MLLISSLICDGFVVCLLKFGVGKVMRLGCRLNVVFILILLKCVGISLLVGVVIVLLMISWVSVLGLFCMKKVLSCVMFDLAVV